MFSIRQICYTSSKKSRSPSFGIDVFGKYPWMAILRTFWLSFFLSVTSALSALDMKRGSLVDTAFSICFTYSLMSEIYNHEKI